MILGLTALGLVAAASLAFWWWQERYHYGVAHPFRKAWHDLWNFADWWRSGGR